MLQAAVTKWVTTRRKADDWSDDLEPLAVLAIALAGSIDAGNVSGPIAKELRSTLADLTPVEVHADAFDLIASELSAAMGNSPH